MAENQKMHAQAARSVTPRGFAVYDEFSDTYGSQIRVQQSSSAEGPRCWIFADRDPHDHLSSSDLHRLAGFDLDELSAKLSPSPHLDVDQARRVRDALDMFIRDHDTGHTASSGLSQTGTQLGRNTGLP